MDAAIDPLLLRIAKSASRRAYAPYSGFRVGAAIRVADGRYFSGCNVENVSYGLTLCAERVALFNCVSSGGGAIDEIVIYTPTETATPPCGACRQVLCELAPTARIYCVCDSTHSEVFLVSDLLPHAFSVHDLKPACPPFKDAGHNGGTPRRICVDIDNVIAESDSVMRNHIASVTDGRVSLNYDDVVVFDYRKCPAAISSGLSDGEWIEAHRRFSEPESILQVAPIPGAVDALAALAKKFALHLATARLPSARSATIDWLANHGFPKHDLHFLTQGEKHVALGKFVASVEDNLEQAMAFAQSGYAFSFLMSHPWNQNVDSGELVRVSSWSEVVDWLL